MRADIVPGARFPDFELTDHTRTRRRLSDLQGIDPMILILSRGHFCPKEHRQHTEMAAFYPQIAVSYTKIVTISSDNILDVNHLRTATGAPWTFLSDAGRHVQKELEIEEYTDSEHNPMIPHTLVLEPGLVVYKIYNGYWYWGRPSAQDLREDLRAVFQKVRPDWDLSKPGLRENYEADRSLHYPYKVREQAAAATTAEPVQQPAG
jgi:peroxiredoxin